MSPVSIPVLANPTAAERRMLRKKLWSALHPDGGPVILDLSDRRVLDHEDIDLLLDCAARVVGRDVELIVVAGSRSNRILLEVARIDSLLQVFTTETEAEMSFYITTCHRRSSVRASDSLPTPGVLP